MKHLNIISISILTAALANAQNISVDFDQGTDVNDFASGANNWFFSNGVGTDSTGGLSTTNANGIAVYESIAFDATSFSDVSISIDFFWDGSANPIHGVSLGFTSGSADTYSDQFTTSGTDFRVRMNTFSHVDNGGTADTVRMQPTINNNSNTAVDTANSAVLGSGWYRLSLAIGSVDNLNSEFDDVTFSILGLNNDGSISGTLATKTITGVAASISSDSEVYAFFGGQNPKVNRGVSVFDNFTVSAIPEPSSYALIAGVLTFGIILLQRRR